LKAPSPPFFIASRARFCWFQRSNPRPFCNNCNSPSMIRALFQPTERPPPFATHSSCCFHPTHLLPHFFFCKVHKFLAHGPSLKDCLGFFGNPKVAGPLPLAPSHPHSSVIFSGPVVPHPKFFELVKTSVPLRLVF